MSFWWLLTIIAIVVFVPFVIWSVFSDYNIFAISIAVILVFCIVVFGFFAIVQPFAVKSTMLRQQKERQQIMYQIEHLTPESDKIKLNEWILTYNDWVNDVNTSKELYGWVSWYYSADMSNHTIIELV